MRTSKEMADLVFQIRDEHLEKKNRFRIIKKVRKEGKAFRKKLRTFVVSKAESIKKEPFLYSTAAASLLGVVGVGIGAIAMWQAITEPLPDNIDPRPPIIVHTTASSQTTTTINTTETTVTTITTVNVSESSNTKSSEMIVTTGEMITELHTEPILNIEEKIETTVENPSKQEQITKATKSYNELSDRQKEWADIIKKEQSYNDLIEPLIEYIYYNYYSVARVIDGLVDENGDHYCIVNYYYTDDYIKAAVEKFLEENGYDSSKVVFNAAGADSENTGFITDPFEAYAIIWKYVTDNYLDWAVNFNYDDLSAIHISVDEDKIDEAKSTIIDMNIDENLINWNLRGIRHY